MDPTGIFDIPNTSLIFWEVITFSILLFLLYRYVFPPIRDRIQQRQNDIERAIEEAERTRVEVAVRHTPGGPVRSGLRAHRSHDVVPVDDCRIAHEGVLATGVFSAAPLRPGAHGQADAPGPTHPGTTGGPTVVALDAVAPSVGDPVLVPLAAPGRGPVSALSWNSTGTHLAFGSETGFAALIDLARR